ncbi:MULTISPECIES: hypothetical protein [unclassified Thioalkalivibrio]|uniref:hypothetical protein n=1 Tax=unclassified Thioalkalivibrio TaxID=2621013 RepID=UPI00035FDD28|nr:MULTISPECIES: hypothetical protein [unclassified Thioalkalivibrio]
MMIKKGLAAAGVAFVLAGCSGGGPSTADIEAVMAQMVAASGLGAQGVSVDIHSSDCSEVDGGVFDCQVDATVSAGGYSEDLTDRLRLVEGSSGWEPAF